MTVKTQYRCWAKVKVLLGSMQHRGFVSEARRLYYAEFVLYKINRLAKAKLWDDCLIAIQACEDEFHDEWNRYMAEELKAA